MNIKNILFTFLLITVFSCGKTISKKGLQTVKDTIITSKNKVIYNEIKLHLKARKVVENWDEYQKLAEFIQQYHNISSTDALFHSNELSNLAQQLKDSIRVEKFKTASVKIRLNVLHNETLRLVDMSTINNISESEVQKENKEILDAYSALNLKINNIINKEGLNSEVSKFIDEVISSPKPNSLIKDTINR